ncbi:MAG: ATP-grasp domain-containing protein [Roseiflexus sp.]
MIPTILVTGIGGPAGRSLKSQLIERGYRIIGTDMRVIDVSDATVYRVPAATDPAFVETLRMLTRESGADLVIPTVSEELPVLARQETWPAPLALAPLEGVLLANDKWQTWQRLAACGVPVPRAMLPLHARSIEHVTQTIGWPCIAKPRIGRGGRGVRLYHSYDIDTLQALDDRYILQEFIPGVEYAPNVCIRGNGRDVVVSLRKTALKQGVVGNAVSVVRDASSDVAALTCAAGRALGLSGVLDIDIRRRSDRSPVVLEVNARFGANSAYAPEILSALLEEMGLPQYCSPVPVI